MSLLRETAAPRKRRSEVRPRSGWKSRRGTEYDEKLPYSITEQLDCLFLQGRYSDSFERNHAIFVVMLNRDIAFHRPRSAIRFKRLLLLGHGRRAVVICDQHPVHLDDGAQAVKRNLHGVPFTRLFV